MKRLISILVALMLVFNFTNVQAEDETSINLDAASAILIDATSGTVLYSKNADKKMYPASITKILTGFLVLKNNINFDDLCTVSKDAIDTIDRTSSHIALDYNEEVKVKDLMYAMLLQSANDASNVLAEKVAKDNAIFVEMMNKAVQEMGLTNTHFTNPHGLQDEDHYTTASDMATIMRYAIQDDKFKEIISTVSYTAEATNKQSEQRVFANGNKMIKKGEYFYEYATGGKTGWTEYSGYTFVGTAKKDGTELICVLLSNSDEKYRYSDALKLFEYGFNNFKTIRISKDLVEPKMSEIYSGKKLAYTVKFNMPYSFDVLVNNNMNEDDIRLEVEITDNDDIDKIEGYVDVYLVNDYIAKFKMDKKVTSYDISFYKTTWPIIVKYFNYLSVFALFSLICINFMKIFKKR